MNVKTLIVIGGITGFSLSANASIIVDDTAFILDMPFGTALLNGLLDDSSAVDFDAGANGLAILRPSLDTDPANAPRLDNAQLTVNNGTKLTLGRGIFAEPVDVVPLDQRRSLITVTGPGSQIELGNNGGNGSPASILLGGKSDLEILDGGQVTWSASNSCNGAFGRCDVQIGRRTTASNQQSNSGILISGSGSLLDASNTGGGFFVGGLPGIVDSAADPNVDGDFLAVLDGGLLRTNDSTIAEANNAAPGSEGEVRATVVIDNATWDIIGTPGSGANLNIGEEGNRADQAGSGNLFIQNGGKVNITAAAGGEAGFYLGQTVDGGDTDGSNLMVIDGAGSALTVNGAGIADGSRIKNGFVTVQNSGQIVINDSNLVISGQTGADLSQFNRDAAQNPGKGSVFNPAAINLDVQTGGSVTVNNGDILIGALAGDDARVRVGVGSSLTAERVIVGLADLDISGAIGSVPAPGYSTVAPFLNPVAPGDSRGELILDNGIINGDVIIDDNGILSGVGTINGDLIAAGGIIAPGFSPGEINVDNFILEAGARLLLEIAVRSDGTYDYGNSDRIVASEAIDLSMGEVIIQLIDTVSEMPLDQVVPPAEILNLANVFDFMDPSNLTAMSFGVDQSTSRLPLMLQVSANGPVISADRVAVVIPLPSTIALFTLGLIGLRFARKR